jgi:hypothetical protein
MTRYITALFVLLVVITSLGCAKSPSPTLPVSDRSAEGFAPTGQAIFGNFTSGTFQPHFHDIALAQVLNVGGGTPGAPMVGFNTCVAVTLNRPSNNDPTGRFKPIFRWLDRTIPGVNVNWGPFWVTDRDFDSNGVMIRTTGLFHAIQYTILLEGCCILALK